MRLLPQHSALLALCATLCTSSVHAASATVRGYWLEPSGSVIRIAPCERGLCIQIVALPAGKQAYTDIHNPNRSLRQRPLCGLRIGEDFVERDAQHADGGHLYDPRSGHMYRGSMTADGDLLELRGYLGLKFFGRTEVWTRAARVPPPCPAA